MKNSKKIGGFKTPLFKALEVSDRTATDYAFVINGKIYATNVSLLIRQDLNQIHDMTDEEIKIIEGKSFHFDLLRALWQFDQVIFTENNIKASKGKSHVEFNYSHQVPPPDFQQVINSAINLNNEVDYFKIGLNSKQFEIINKVFCSSRSNMAINLPEKNSKAIIITSSEYDFDDQFALLMPVLLNS